ncbi:hypothetical protein Mgra_00009751 [Meloidogyne graminicola]|uniref:Uncharacterized protein n=1 Tax=Meloidogyne graminicola TaxID=189291 RepID=A0A8S9ZCY8_9BILA|nr:hypothetical protein Mgra_00009751 [Meloidogyne graminicola]
MGAKKPKCSTCEKVSRIHNAGLNGCSAPRTILTGVIIFLKENFILLNKLNICVLSFTVRCKDYSSDSNICKGFPKL